MTQAYNSDSDASGEYLYHLVCHDCPTESLSESASETEEQLDEHRSSTGHNIEVARLTNELKI